MTQLFKTLGIVTTPLTEFCVLDFVITLKFSCHVTQRLCVAALFYYTVQKSPNPNQ